MQQRKLSEIAGLTLTFDPSLESSGVGLLRVSSSGDLLIALGGCFVWVGTEVPEVGFPSVHPNAASRAVVISHIVSGVVVPAFCRTKVPVEGLFGIGSDTFE